MGVGAVGNGVHIHYSLSDRDGAPMTHDPRGPGELSPLAGRFTAGILAAMPSLVALTAPSMVSYERLQPNRWSAAFNNLADKNREAGVRICPVSGGDVARAFNLEYRAADATASPYLALGALVWAGLDGLRRELAPPHPCETPPDRMTETERARLNLRRLPATLAEALDTLEEDAALRSWMGGEFHQAYLIHKRGELDSLRDLTQEEQVRRYAEAY
jgi:glutamine synthetase